MLACIKPDCTEFDDQPARFKKLSDKENQIDFPDAKNFQR